MVLALQICSVLYLRVVVAASCTIRHCNLVNTTTARSGGMGAASSPDDARTQDEVFLVDMEEMLRRSLNRLERDVSATQPGIHRFPHHLIGIGSQGSYVEPSVVAIGPYHHRLPRLQKMEEVKKAVAYKFCRRLGLSVEEVYLEILAVACDARRCYDAMAVADLNDADFAAMMFVDGCFLLWYMTGNLHDPLLVGFDQSSGPIVRKDIFLLENQIPWLVLDALSELADQNVVQLVAEIGGVPSRRKVKNRWEIQWGCILDRMIGVGESHRSDSDMEEHINPPHLLGLLRFVLISNMPPHKRGSKFHVNADNCTLPKPICAVKLLEIGVKLTHSRAGWFAHMNFQKKLVFGELSLSPLSLGDVKACWLVNMVALESTLGTTPVSWVEGRYAVTSYLKMLAMLMDQEEDVHELRKSGVLTSNFSDAQTLALFKGFGQHLGLGYNYFHTLKTIQEYMRRRRVRIAIHKFFYNNYKSIATVLSITGALIGIFKALYSLKH